MLPTLIVRGFWKALIFYKKVIIVSNSLVYSVSMSTTFSCVKGKVTLLYIYEIRNRAKDEWGWQDTYFV